MSYYTPKQIVETVSKCGCSESFHFYAQNACAGFFWPVLILGSEVLLQLLSRRNSGHCSRKSRHTEISDGLRFPIGLMFCALAGAGLFTGNTAYFIPPVMDKKLRVTALLRNRTLVYFGNFVGALFVAYFMVTPTAFCQIALAQKSIYSIAELKLQHHFTRFCSKLALTGW